MIKVLSEVVLGKKWRLCATAGTIYKRQDSQRNNNRLRKGYKQRHTPSNSPEGQESGRIPAGSKHPAHHYQRKQ